MTAHVLVTGGAGFIGSHLVEALIAKGYGVRVLDNLHTGCRDWLHPKADLFEGDITDPATCHKAVKGVAGVFHLAAMSRVLPGLDYVAACTKVNVLGTENILMAAAQQPTPPKIVYSGSSTYYGNQPVPHREYETAHEPLNAYGVTKAAGERYCLLFASHFKAPAIVLRYFNVYGPRQPQVGQYALVMGIFLNRWAADETLIIHGDGSQRRDFTHVRDVATANIMAFESAHNGKIYNVGSGSNISIAELASMISEKQQFAERRTGDSMATLADITRIQQDLGWRPQVSLEDGLAELKERVKNGLES